MAGGMANNQQNKKCGLVKLVVPRKPLTCTVTPVKLTSHQHYLLVQQRLLTQRLAKLRTRTAANLEIQHALQADLRAIQAQLVLVS
ncbi:hypothetical protein MUDAN_BIHEEGNE_00840 [Lactiplantibacillus mudanjiangensis]|uniref:Uncharacterized protein n=2 Tax=Lactiplantibacillus mudanjiangensis TaxID=1296538 RepID=A0A660E3C9_9LACO|nr:hypothetical protein MUDAN_BIHEEGNE_00840 [Lactiplantibacillus mudanjiangensis]VDG25284.1 hypothetical protein MUDAN_IGPPGNFN_01023 [Lactiplantibacillus mudanjiangensis]VDG27463.1 hypothetical protein MUDAN_MDHGFNIF_02326 [Lactiplantibacillus mudanjiangensis]